MYRIIGWTRRLQSTLRLQWHLPFYFSSLFVFHNCAALCLDCCCWCCWHCRFWKIISISPLNSIKLILCYWNLFLIINFRNPNKMIHASYRWIKPNLLVGLINNNYFLKYIFFGATFPFIQFQFLLLLDNFFTLITYF